ncbi:hypothetical protein ACIOJD_25220 [Streptomyces sp. NPDC088116]|uniref:hypothetical protein n=1 Tax=Streptomyces sp. NPDC088116 TaxID=3365825 RepID=UPI003823418B
MAGPLWLRDEDRPDYAQAVDEAIRSPEGRQLIRRSSLRIGHVRVRALDAGPRIASMASAEYESYTALRRRARDGAGRSEPVSLSGRGEQEAGAGVLPLLAVLTPVLACVAAVTFLVLGHGLSLVDGELALAGALIQVGWVSLGLAALTAVLAFIGLYRTAARNRDSMPAGPAPVPAEVLQAREAWLTALRDRGVLPFLRDQLGEAEPAVGPGGDPEVRRGPRFSSPEFSSPDFAGPDFSSPTSRSDE